MIQKLLVIPGDASHSSELRIKMMLTIFGFLTGTVMAFRFNVFILVPTILFGWGLVLVGGLITSSSVASIALQVVVVALALQIGYLAGFVFKWALLVSRRRNWSDKPVVVSDGTFFQKPQ
jgi:hypothetical protein